MAGKVEGFEVEINAAPQRLWKAYKDGPKLLPKLLPDLIRSVDWIQGDGGVGSIREVKFGPGVKGLEANKEAIDVVDDEKHTLSYHVLEGEIKKSYSSYKVTTQIVPTGSSPAKSLFKYTINYEPIGEAAPPQQHSQGFLGFLKLLEAHLLANEAEYI